jgi:predicted RNA binding protein YcfA (HicA-like mRNA interferase family)
LLSAVAPRWWILERSSQSARSLRDVPQFPSIKAKRLLRILTSDPLNYRITRQSGSHRRLTGEGLPPLTWAFHDGRTLAPGEVRRVLVHHVGLAEEDALRLL